MEVKSHSNSKKQNKIIKDDDDDNAVQDIEIDNKNKSSYPGLGNDNINNPEYALGIDEAGRGPVLGPMVYACCYWKINDEDDINSSYKFNDSKKLTDKIRRRLFDDIKKDKRIHYHVEIHPAQEISNKMIRRPKDIINLNEISQTSAVGLLNKAIEAGFNISQVYADAVGPNSKYASKLSDLCIKKTGINIIAEEKADSKYKVVSAASIVAKVTRDTIIENWKFIENNGLITFSKKIGSGYPADPKTKLWLKNNFDPVFGYPSIVRFSWKTVSIVIWDQGVKLTFKDYKDEPDGKKRSNFIQQEKNNNKQKKLVKKDFDYFKDRNINIFVKQPLFN